VNTSVDPIQFVQAVQPVLERRDLPGLLALLKNRWTGEQIVAILVGRNADARKVAALSLALVGCRKCLPPLAEQLKDPDPMVNQLAEHAMWNIWFRLGSDAANHELCRGAKAIDRGDYDHAITHFDRALQLSPDFAEAYNQRALAKYLLERYEDSLADCKIAVQLMPNHFGAWAGIGHCHADLGRLPQAVESYQRALDINPHMSQVREAIEELKSQIGVDV
jgi:tetratricopeptide (TPR) repeat protein